MAESDDGFWGVRTTENLDSHLIQHVTFGSNNDQLESYAAGNNEPLGEKLDSHLSQHVTCGSDDDQLELNAAENNEPADVSEPKLMTPVSCLNEICVGKKLSMPQYESIGEVGVAHLKTFTMSVCVHDMGLNETGVGQTKMEAKHKAAKNVLDKISAAAERNESLHLLTSDCVMMCYEMRKNFILFEQQKEDESVTTRYSAGFLRKFELARDMPPAVFECVDESGSSHNKIFTMICRQGDLITRGTGKSKQIAKNIAASQMMKIFTSRENINSSLS